MEKLQQFRVLEFRPDTLVESRKSVDLDNPKRLNEAINILEDWTQKQAHFIKKDFSREYLERMLLTSKGSVERAKLKIDKLCTYKTLMPEFFTVTDVTKDFARLRNIISTAVLPKLTKDHYRVYVNRVNSEFETEDVLVFFNYVVMLCEYMVHHEYSNGFILITDLRNVNIMNVITKLPPVTLSRLISLVLEGYGLRLKTKFILSESKTIGTLVSFLKQFLKPKLGERLHAINSIESMYELVPREILPVEYGGEERSLQTLNDEWLDVLGSAENMAWYQEMIKASTNESFRTKNVFEEQYLGIPGAFRTLSVD